eukprot:TRINITY_DN191_c0_g1_i11.p1 TRINITY_DN191_c0_g1~~TRINITY_DN191_c0_g1_i11.p1  ORF type:complete len:210 (-),score=56.16 TRINITY_DN191_c0_g1_i11:23-652(-)
MGLKGFKDETRAFTVLILFHYMGYIIFRVLEFLQYPKRVYISYDFRTFFTRKCPGDAPQTSQTNRAANPFFFFFFLMIRRPPRSTPLYSSAASDVYKRQADIKLEVAGSAAPAPSAASSETLDDKDRDMTKVVKTRYRKNSFFFFVGIFCAILAGNKTHCLVITYLVLLTATAEIVGIFFGILGISYIAHAVQVIINYMNIITAIDAFC